MDYAVEKPVENPVDNTLKKVGRRHDGVGSGSPAPARGRKKTGTLTEKAGTLMKKSAGLSEKNAPSPATRREHRADAPAGRRFSGNRGPCMCRIIRNFTEQPATAGET